MIAQTKTPKTIDWTQKDLYLAIDRPELRPDWMKKAPGHCELCGAELVRQCFSQDADGNHQEWLLTCPECN